MYGLTNLSFWRNYPPTNPWVRVKVTEIGEKICFRTIGEGWRSW